MTAWEHTAGWVNRLAEGVGRLEKIVVELQAGLGLPRWEALRDPETGWYSRGYVVHRLPAEIARSQRTGRPCGLALLCTGDPGRPPGERGRWRWFLMDRLDPFEVAVAYSERDVLFLFPELDEAASRARIVQLAEAACVAGLIAFPSARVAWASYPETRLAPAALLHRLEEGLIPLEKAIAPAPAGHEDGPRARHQAPHVGEPATVEIPPGRTYPGCFWLANEHVEIRAVLDEETDESQDLEAPGRRRLTVVTDRGDFLLERAGERWFAQKLDSAGSPS